MNNIYVGDYIYFVRGNVEYLGEVIGINVDKVITVKYKDENGQIKIQPIGSDYSVKLANITGLKQLDVEHPQKERQAYLDDEGNWKFV